MTTVLNYSTTDDVDLLSFVAERQPMADLFRAACFAEGRVHDGYVDPNKVNARVRAQFAAEGLDFTVKDSRAYSAQWAGARGANGFLDQTEIPVAIDGSLSKGNGNKGLFLHRLRASP